MFFSVPVHFRPPVKSLGPELVETNWLLNVSDACRPLSFSMRRLEWFPARAALLFLSLLVGGVFVTVQSLKHT